MERNGSIPHSQAQVAESGFMSKVYLWMASGLFLSAFGTLFAISSPWVMSFLVSVDAQGRAGLSMGYWGIAISEIVLVIWLSRAMWTLPFAAALGGLALYSFLNGITLSLIFLAYTGSSIASTFAIAAGTFAFFSLYGFMTKSDLSGVRNIAIMGVIGVLIALVVNMFLRSSMMDLVISFIGVAVFIALTAADTQKLKNIFRSGLVAEPHRMALNGALMLYLDFINLFLFLLRILGNRR